MRAPTGHTTPRDIFPKKMRGKGLRRGGSFLVRCAVSYFPRENTQELTDTELIDKHGNSLLIHTLLRELGGESREINMVL